VNAAVIAALIACLAFAAAGPRLARVLTPAAAVRLLVPAALLAAGAGVFVLGTVTFTWLGQLAEVAEFGHWSPQRLQALNPIPPVASLIAGGLLLPIAVWTISSVARTVQGLWIAQRTCRQLDNPDGSPIVVMDSTDPDAFTITGVTARTVVTTGILAALDADGRRILLAHERSHRAHRHTWWTLAADLAAAINPLLRPTAHAIRHATERWADEDAAATADRRRVAATIAQVALLRTQRPKPSTTAAATGGSVPQRIQALLRPPPRTRTRYLGVLAALILALLLGALAVAHTGETLFEQAKQPATARWHSPTAPWP
jgi:Zn-dependent protease with chaperone function